jgi:hypothetical protein
MTDGIAAQGAPLVYTKNHSETSPQSAPTTVWWDLWKGVVRVLT